MSVQIPAWRCEKCGIVVEIIIEESPQEAEEYDYNDIQRDGTVLVDDELPPLRDLQVTLFCMCTYKRMSGQFEVRDNR